MFPIFVLQKLCIIAFVNADYTSVMQLYMPEITNFAVLLV